MIRAILSMAALLAPLQATALSCSSSPLEHDLINAVDDTSGPWVIGIGRMIPDSHGILRTNDNNGRSTITQTYRFHGVLLSQGNPDQPIETNVVATSCEGLWCLAPCVWATDQGFL